MHINRPAPTCVFESGGQYDPTAFALRARDEVYCGAEALPFSVARCVVPKAINAMANKTSPFDHDAIDSAPQFYSCIGLS